MKKIIFTSVLIFLIFNSISFSQQRYPLIEVMTNYKCGLCPKAHNTLDNYVSDNPDGKYLNFIFYHMNYPYANDPFYQHNTKDVEERDAYYGQGSFTPKAYFDGSYQINNYNEWPGYLDAIVNEQSPLIIELSGFKEGNNMTINADIERTGLINDNDLKLHFVVVETIDIQTQNGIYPQLFVMRKMYPSANGEDFTIAQGEQKTVKKTIQLNPEWIPDSLSVVVFVQGNNSMQIHQSDRIDYKDLLVTSVNESKNKPEKFELMQNYPNPFNPSTKINFSISTESYVSLKVYNILGKEVTTLVSGNRDAGNYEINFNAESLSGGVYIYKLTAKNSKSNFEQTKKMILLK